MKAERDNEILLNKNRDPIAEKQTTRSRGSEPGPARRKDIPMLSLRQSTGSDTMPAEPYLYAIESVGGVVLDKDPEEPWNPVPPYKRVPSSQVQRSMHPRDISTRDRKGKARASSSHHASPKLEDVQEWNDLLVVPKGHKRRDSERRSRTTSQTARVIRETPIKPIRSLSSPIPTTHNSMNATLPPIHAETVGNEPSLAHSATPDPSACRHRVTKDIAQHRSTSERDDSIATIGGSHRKPAQRNDAKRDTLPDTTSDTSVWRTCRSRPSIESLLTQLRADAMENLFLMDATTSRVVLSAIKLARYHQLRALPNRHADPSYLKMKEEHRKTRKRRDQTEALRPIAALNAAATAHFKLVERDANISSNPRRRGPKAGPV